MDSDPRRSIARLVAAVMAADARVTPSEVASLTGLGPLEAFAPIKVIELGCEFAALAVRRLAAATAAFTTVVGGDATPPGGI